MSKNFILHLSDRSIETLPEGHKPQTAEDGKDDAGSLKMIQDPQGHNIWLIFPDWKVQSFNTKTKKWTTHRNCNKFGESNFDQRINGGFITTDGQIILRGQGAMAKPVGDIFSKWRLISYYSGFDDRYRFDPLRLVHIQNSPNEFYQFGLDSGFTFSLEKLKIEFAKDKYI